MNTLEEKKHHEIKLKEGLKDLAVKRMELQNASSSSWPKQVSFIIFLSFIIGKLFISLKHFVSVVDHGITDCKIL